MSKKYAWHEKYRDYNGIRLNVDDFKENGYYQFKLDTPLPFIDTNKDFKTPEHAFKYAEQRIKVEFKKILKKIEKNEFETQHIETYKDWGK